jgi:type 2 lantibiotic biosynthesis protein LanM
LADSELDLDVVVWRAMFLRERLLQCRDRPDQKQAMAKAQLDRWRSAVEPAGGDWFEKRLRWDGIDASRLGLALADEAQASGEPPSWAAVLREISETAQRVGRSGPTLLDASPTQAGSPLPFEHVLLPAVLVGRNLLCSRLGLTADELGFPIRGLISRAAYRALERGLLTHLSEIAGETLQCEFSRFRPFGRNLARVVDLPDLEPSGDTHYRSFVGEHLGNGWSALLRSYPVLGRLIATAVELWADATAELIDRLVRDRDLLARSFGITSNQVGDIETSLGDRHRGGRAVAVLVFDDGRKVAYKPKPMAMEDRFNRVLEWCKERGASPGLLVTRVLDCGEYGWAEYVEHRPCESEAEAERFYRRAGMLLCLLHVLRATDCHYENLVAHGDQPVLIDAETLMYPDPQPLGAIPELEPGASAADRPLAATVLRTGMLPRWQVAGDGEQATDTSALGRGETSAAAGKPPRWQHVNTDDMQLRDDDAGAGADHHVARLADRALSVLDYQAELIAGFESMYRFLLAYREPLCAADGPLAAMRSLPVRFIYRPTRVYGALLTSAWRPETLRDGVEYGIHLERLARAFLVAAERPAVWPVFGAEVRATGRLDVPLFLTRTDGTDLELDDGGAVRDAFTKPAHATMLELVAAMSEADLERQLLVIRAAFEAKAARTPSGGSAGDAVDLEERPALSDDDLVRAATAVGLEIEARALSDGRQAVSWIGMSYLERADRYELEVLNDSLYDGCCGVALFLAALGQVTGEARFASLSLRGLHGLRRRIHEVDPGSHSLVARMRGLGGGVGLGSVIYGLVRVSGFLDGDDPDLLEDAAALAGWITPTAIADDDALDVMSGSAGAVLGLLALHAASGDERALQAAVACAEHLLEHRVDANGHRAWRTVHERPLTGFSHGAAGIAYSLVRLYGVTGDRAFLDAACEGIEFERALFDERRGNWPDVRPAGAADPTGFPVKWCHGAAGIVLARLGCRRIAEIAGIEAEIDAGLRATRERYLQKADFLCCGNLGRAETFLVAAGLTDDPESRRLAATGAASVVARAASSGGYRLFAAAGSYNPGFFTGTAGIGYQLLRLARPDLPSVLLWE